MSGDEVKAIRESLGLTQAELSHWLGVATTSISRLERGERKVSGLVMRLLLLLKASNGRLIQKNPWTPID